MIYNDSKRISLYRIKNCNGFLLYFIPFIILSAPVLIQILTNNIPVVEGYYSMHYLLTYDHGFVGRGLVGEILSWFFENLTIRIINIINVVFTEVLVVAASLCIGSVLNNSRKNTNNFFVIAFLVLILCLGQFTVGTYYADIKMDKFILALTLISLLFAENRFLCYLIPAFCVISVLINPVFCFTSFILIVVVLFDKFQRNSYSFKSGFLLFTTCALVVFIAGYASIAQSHLGFKNADEFLDFYYRRSDYQLPQDLREIFADEWLFEYFDHSPLELLKDTFITYFVKWNNGAKTIISTVFLAVPSVAATFIFWFKTVKIEKNKFRKFIYFICMVSFVPSVPALVLSWEATKYYGSYLFVQITLLIYFLNQNDNSVNGTVDMLKRKIKEYPMPAVAAMGYFMTLLMVK